MLILFRSSAGFYQLLSFSIIRFATRSTRVLGEMQIFIKPIRGGAFTIEIESPYNPDTLHLKIQEKTGLVPYHQKLVYLGKILEGWESMSHLNLQEGSTIHMIYRIPPPNFPPHRQRAEENVRTFMWHLEVSSLVFSWINK